MRRGNLSFFIPHAGCPHRCSFCDQHSISGTPRPPEPKEVAKSCEQAFDQWRQQGIEGEIAFFGGSFTAIPIEEMEAYLQAAAPFLRRERSPFWGIRVSTRPDALEENRLRLLQKYGVTAVELGAQSMCDELLALNQRGHTAAQVEAGAKALREHGFALGLQMMTGLPGSTPERDWETARRLAALCPATMRIYPALALENTLMGRWYAQGSYRPPGLEETAELCAGLLDFFEQQGIRVIRLGLHPGRELEQKLVGGPYHPAFRELCEGERWFLRATERLKQQFPLGTELPLELCVPPGALSQAAGLNRRNVARWKALGYDVAKITPVSDGSFEIKPYTGVLSRREQRRRQRGSNFMV